MNPSKPNMRTRKVVNYLAMNGDDSDDSGDDFKNRVNKAHTPSASATPTKPSKLNKLKLGARRETKVPIKQNDSCFTKLKSKGNEVDQETPIKPSSLPGSNTVDEINLSVAEPDLNIHSIFSQETVIDSSCECQSSQETIDSSSEPPSPASSTVELLAVEELVKPNEISVAENVKSKPLKVNRVIKRHIIDESDSSPNAKKSKVEINEDEKQGGFQDTVSPSKTTTQQLPSCVVLIDKLPKNLSPQLGKSTVHNTLPITHQIHLSKETSTQLLEDKLEEASVPKIATLDIAETSIKEATKIKQVFEAIPTVTAKLTKKATKAIGQHELQSNKPDNSRIKSNATNLNEKKGKLKTTSKPVANGKSANSPSKIDKELRNRVHDSLEKINIPSKDIKTIEHVDIIKQSSPPSRKCPTKTPQWNPPGKASGPTTPSKGSSPAIGLRLGLSRNRRANKPLHPDVKLKI